MSTTTNTNPNTLSLYPERSRQELEIGFHTMLCALRVAAQDKIGGASDAAYGEIVETWIRRGEVMSTTTAAALHVTNECMKAQTQRGGAN